LKYLFLLAGAALMFWGIWTWKRELRRTSPQSKTAADSGRRELEGVVEELVAVSEEVLGDVKTRSEELKDLIRQADHRISELRTMSGAIAVTAGRADAAASREFAGSEIPESYIPRESAGSRQSGGGERYAEILALASQGLEVTEIARVTNRSKGEVQLILDLKNLER